MESENELTPETNPERKKPNAFSSFIKRSGIFPYLRELSVVIIGILITLFITNLINNHNRQADLDGMLSLVKQELYKNLEDLEWIQSRWEGEVYIFNRIRKHNYVVEAIPEDTLRKYTYAIGALYSFSPKNDSYEVLKNSIQAQYIKQKDLLQNLSYAYGRMNQLNTQLSRYSTQKNNYTTPIFANMEVDEAEKAMSDNAYDAFRFYAKDKGYRIFFHIGPTILSEEIFDECNESIEKVISSLEKYGY